MPVSTPVGIFIWTSNLCQKGGENVETIARLVERWAFSVGSTGENRQWMKRCSLREKTCQMEGHWLDERRCNTLSRLDNIITADWNFHTHRPLLLFVLNVKSAELQFRENGPALLIGRCLPDRDPFIPLQPNAVQSIFKCFSLQVKHCL
jgi:hypothetical protein